MLIFSKDYHSLTILQKIVSPYIIILNVKDKKLRQLLRSKSIDGNCSDSRSCFSRHHIGGLYLFRNSCRIYCRYHPGWNRKCSCGFYLCHPTVSRSQRNCRHCRNSCGRSTWSWSSGLWRIQTLSIKIVLDAQEKIMIILPLILLLIQLIQSLVLFEDKIQNLPLNQIITYKLIALHIQFMNKDSLEAILDSLQIFVELKQQKTIIYAWIELKKFISLSNEPRNSTTSSNQKHYQYKQSVQRLPLKSNQASPRMNKSELQRSSQKFKKERFVTEEQKNNSKEQMFQTFNKFRQSNEFSNQDLQTYRFEPQKVVNPIFPTLYQQISDNDQFEDIVLDRLSQLQQKINMMMRSRRIQNEQRGYVGAPIRNTITQQDNYKDYVLDIDDDISVDKSEDEVQQRYKARRPRNYEWWKDDHVNQGQTDKIYKIKYIPMLAKEDPEVNIHKIKQLIEISHRQDQQIVNQNRNGLKVSKTIDAKYSKSYANNNSFNGNKGIKQRKQKKLNFITNTYNDGNEEPSRQRGSTTLYLNRYGGAQGSKGTNQVHFVPKHIQMQTVIEQGSKYLRKPSNRNLNNARFKKQNYIDQEKGVYNGKQSKVSNSSSNSQLTPRQRGLNNKSALY